MIDVDSKTRRSRMHSDTDDSEIAEDVYSGQVMQPIIVQPLKDFKLTEGQDATFFCKVAGVPRPRVSSLFKFCFILFCCSMILYDEKYLIYIINNSTHNRSGLKTF